MNRYQFEDLISAYIDNEISLSKRKEFEGYLKDNPDSEKLVSAIKGNITKLNQITRLKVKSSFNDDLKRKIDALNSNSKLGKHNNLVLGFSPLNASFLFGLFVAFFIISFQFINSYSEYRQIKQSHLVNNGLNNNIPSSGNNSKVMKPDLVDAKKDTLKTDVKKQDRKNLSNKIQLVND